MFKQKCNKYFRYLIKTAILNLKKTLDNVQSSKCLKDIATVHCQVGIIMTTSCSFIVQKCQYITKYLLFDGQGLV